MRQWLKLQWQDSMGQDIWKDLTPFGRATIWIPLWLLCVVCVLLIAAVGYPLYLVSLLLDKLPELPKLPPIFFR